MTSSDVNNSRRIRVEIAERRGAFHSFLLDQRTLQRASFQRDPVQLVGEERVAFLRWNVLAAVRELTEMLDEVDGWKPWDSVHRGEDAGRIPDRAAFVEEGVDVLHFVANVLLLAGVNDKELSQVFTEKQQRNAARQRGGYDGSGKSFDKLLSTIQPDEPAEDYK